MVAYSLILGKLIENLNYGSSDVVETFKHSKLQIFFSVLRVEICQSFMPKG